MADNDGINEDSAELGSRLKANDKYGQNASTQAASLNPGETKSPIDDVSPSQAAVPSLNHADTLGARVHMGADGKAAAIPAHPTMAGRPHNSGSPSAKIGSKTNHSPKR